MKLVKGACLSRAVVSQHVRSPRNVPVRDPRIERTINGELGQGAFLLAE